MKGQHKWSAKWYESGPVNGASVKVCEVCGAELIATWADSEPRRSSPRKRVANLVYVAPCDGKSRG